MIHINFILLKLWGRNLIGKIYFWILFKSIDCLLSLYQYKSVSMFMVFVPNIYSFEMNFLSGMPRHVLLHHHYRYFSEFPWIFLGLFSHTIIVTICIEHLCQYCIKLWAYIINFYYEEIGIYSQPHLRDTETDTWEYLVTSR